VVHMFHAYPEADVNTLLEGDYLDPVSGFPGFKALLCAVKKVQPGATAGPDGTGRPASAAAPGNGGTSEVTR